MMAFKRRKLLEDSKAKLGSLIELLGRDIHVFTYSSTSRRSHAVYPSMDDEPDDFYDLTPEDYYHIMSSKMEGEPRILKTSKMGEAELVAHRACMTKAVVRVCFPDNCIIEAEFHPYETIQSLVDLVRKVISRPEQPFYLYTTPPKERIMDMSKEFYSAGFYPGAIVFFSYDQLNGLLVDIAEPGNESGRNGPYLRDDVLSLNGLDLSPEPVIYSEKEPAMSEPPSIPSGPERLAKIPSGLEPVAKKPTRPKWFKL